MEKIIKLKKPYKGKKKYAKYIKNISFYATKCLIKKYP